MRFAIFAYFVFHVIFDKYLPLTPPIFHHMNSMLIVPTSASSV